jgi:trehalose 6-phosphate synthase/phosphatase
LSRVVIVANRMPYAVRLEGSHITLERAVGGLATALRRLHDESGTLWVGWPGDLPRLSRAQRAELDEKLRAIRAVPVPISKREVAEFYEDISNAVLWPTFHYLIDNLPVNTNTTGWDTYRRVNERFARRVAEFAQPGDLVWVHDYQLALVPRMVRELVPGARVGFFLHIPFPSSEVFSVLPWREEILAGILGADLLGFHTAAYLRHFVTSARRVLGVDATIEGVRFQGRETRFGVFPIGIDAQGWTALGEDPDVVRRAQEVRDEARGQQILVGVDRLDYTKGIPRRLLALDRLLEIEPSLRGHVRLIQASVPSRGNVESYRQFRRSVDELVGQINARWGTETWVPIHHLYRPLDDHEIAALYRAADVMLVTPVRDGMNLVAKEFIACRPDGDGTLVLSEFAGAATELGGAIHVNPYDIDGMARQAIRALRMPEAERRRRMARLREGVVRHTADWWANRFVEQLRCTPPQRMDPQPLDDSAQLIASLRSAPALQLVLDYDGTLVPFAPTPEQAAPDHDLLDLIARLAARPGTAVDIVSGRHRDDLEAWLGTSGAGLHAEHGLWSKPAGQEWRLNRNISPAWKDRVRPILEHFCEITPGAIVEEKTVSLAWHYRRITDEFVGEIDFGEFQARELRLLLRELLGGIPVEILLGDRVIEVRPHGVNKGAIVPAILARWPRSPMVLAIGDDTTDEDLFAALPLGAISIRVGDGASQATLRIGSTSDARQLLAALAG